MIFITGDTHAEWMQRLNMNAFPEQKELTKEDYVIILGDFGIWDNSKREKYNLDWLESRSFTTLFVSGNHENYDMLDNLPVEEWHGGKVNFIRPSVIHLRRGQIFDIDGQSFFAFGGASSHDISSGILEPTDPEFKLKKKELDKDPYALYRINHVSWWERELPSDEEMAEGLESLKQHNNKVDYILTHSPASSFLYDMAGEDLYNKDCLTEYLEYIRTNIEYKYFLFGHMHVNKSLPDKKAACIYEQIVRLI